MNYSITKMFETRIFSNLKAIINEPTLFESTLSSCYSKKDIQRLIELVNTRGRHYFSASQKTNFFLKVDSRAKMIEFMNKKCKNSFYRMHEIHAMLQKCTFSWQCDAIMLHVEKNKSLYLQIRPLTGYQILVTRRKEHLLEIQSN